MLEYAYTPAIELRRAIAAREVSPVEVMRQCLERAHALEPQLNCFVTLTPEEALGAAARAEKAVMAGEPLGALHGIPVSVKDLIAMGGIKQTFGSRTMASNIAATDVPPPWSGSRRRVPASSAKQRPLNSAARAAARRR